MYNDRDDEWKQTIKYRREICNFLGQYDYEWFCSLNLPDYNVVNGEKHLKKWRISMQVKDNIQISYLGVIVVSKVTGPHIHLLMCGKNKDGDTLLNRNPKLWEDEWSDITKKDSWIEIVNDENVVKYLSQSGNTPINNFELVQPYNKKFLVKHKKNTPSILQ